MQYNTCVRCRNSFIAGSSWVTYCTLCQHTEAIEKQSREIEFRKNLQSLELIRQQQLTRQAIQYQTLVLAENAIASEEAYNKGQYYIDTQGLNNSINLEIEINENGELLPSYDKPYLTDRLNEQFTKGLRKKLSSVPSVDTACLAICARKAGIENALGELPAKFDLAPICDLDNIRELVLSGIPVKTTVFDSNFQYSLNEDTGEIMMTWKNPFTTEEYNKEYKAGVQSIYDEVNTYELKRQRREIIQLRERKKKTRVIITIFGVLICFTLLFTYIIF